MAFGSFYCTKRLAPGPVSTPRILLNPPWTTHIGPHLVDITATLHNDDGGTIKRVKQITPD
jgi:hypothetical protein